MILLLILQCVISCNRFENLNSDKIYQATIGFFDKGQFYKMKFSYSVPPNYKPDKKYPVIVALHGYGVNMEAFHNLFLEVCKKEDYILVTPQGEEEVYSNIGYSWTENSPIGIMKIVDFISQRININKKEIYAIGFSDGGRLAYVLGVNHFQHFKGIAALSAPFSEKLLPGNFVMLKEYKAYISYGELEKGISLQAKLASKILSDANIKTKLVEYKAIGHDLPEPKSAEIKKILDFFEE